MNRAERLKSMVEQLSEMEQRLREYVMDDCEKEEDRLSKATFAVYDDHVEQEDGTLVGIVYMENASPELDAATHCLWEAQMMINEELAK